MKEIHFEMRGFLKNILFENRRLSKPLVCTVIYSIFLVCPLIFSTCSAAVTAKPSVSEKNLLVTILHTNDVHSRFAQTNKHSGACSADDEEKNKCYGGFPRLHYKVLTIFIPKISMHMHHCIIQLCDMCLVQRVVKLNGTTMLYNFL